MNAIESQVAFEEGCINSFSFEQFYADYYQRIFLFVLKKISSELDAEDITGETFLVAYSEYDRMVSGRIPSPLGYIFKTASNLSSNYLRDKYKHPHNDDGIEGYVVDIDPLPEDQTVMRENANTINDAFQQLSELHRTALVMQKVEEMSMADMAKVMGIEENAVKGRLFRARSSLNEVLPDDIWE